MNDRLSDTSTSRPDEKALPYNNSSIRIEERLADLLGRMTLEEKVAQMQGIWQQKATKLVDASGKFDSAKARAAFQHGHGLGQVGRLSDSGSDGHNPASGRDARQQAELANAVQRFFVEESRLGIPVFIHEECLHGHAALHGTSFPQPIALAASFNPSLVEELYAMTAEETRVRGAHQALTPVVDVAREPRWGRVEETFGEDPWLVSRMGVAAVRGFQGDASFSNKKHVVATLKHFAAHGEPEAGMNCAPANISERVLRDVFLAPFRAAIDEAGAISLMASYNEIDGVPSHANEWLLRKVLRDEWGFDGFIVSDYYAIWELHYRPDTHGHFVAHDKKEACALAVKAGVNIELPEPDCYLHLTELVQDGTIKEAEVDSLVAPMLRWKFKMGLFENPFVDPDEADRIVGSTRNRGLVRKAARECITLLQNRDRVLPLDPDKAGTIAVIGPNASRSLLGGYSGVPKSESTVLEGITDRVGARAKVEYAKGCQITVGGSWNEDAVTPGNPDEDHRLIAEAVEIAQRADVVILAIGGNEQTAREAWSRSHMGDRTSLELFGRQQELVDAIAATGKPIVACLFNGRPLAISGVSEKASAVLECWYLGQETGNALADVLFGDFNPGGKLPITIPRSVGHLPAFYNHKPSARRGFLLDDVSPLYPFGFGLSYTSFATQNIRLAADTIAASGSTAVSVDVTNMGDRAGSEVLQLYIRDCVSSATRPVKELKGFERVYLEPGQTKNVSMVIGFQQLAFHDLNMKHVVEPGAFDIMVGTSSRDADLSKVTLHVSR